MKNLNLFTWLLECSGNAAKIGLIPCQLRQQDGKNTAKGRQKDGKSSIYRRIITLLTLLLTLGVGQMWADSSVTGASIKYDVNSSSNQWWDVSGTAKQLGQVSTFKLKGFWAQLGTENVCQNTCMYYGLTSACSLGSYNIKDPNDWSPSTKHFQTESMNVNILSGLTPNKYTLYAKFIGHGKKSGNDCGEISSSTYQMKFEYPAYLSGDGTWCGSAWNATDNAQKMTYNDGGYYSKTVSSVTKADHQLKVATYGWASSWGSAKYDASNSSNVYSESDASGNLKFQPAMAGDVTIKFNISDQKISIICTAPTITLDDEGGSGGSGTQNTYYNVATSNVSVPTKTGYIFGGYYDGDDGTGNQIINASGVWQKNKSNFTDNSSTPKWIVRANHTLYAKWLPQSLTITAHPDYLTTTSKLNLSISYENIPEGYCFRVHELRTNGYYNSEAHGTYDPISGTGSTTYTSSSSLPTGDVDRIVVELWKISPFEKQSVVSNEVEVIVEQGWEVSVQATADGVISTAGGTVSPASVSPTAHIGQTITASEPNTGYNFTGWTATTANITFADASELSTTVYASAGGTVYANYVRQSGSYSTTFYAGDHGSINAKGTAIAKNGNASVTIGNDEPLSATPESAEYVFDHWGTIGSVTVADIYAASTTVTATAAGGTVTAYYRHRPTLGAVTATPSGTQNYAGAPIDFALSVTSTYMAHPVVVFLVNDGTTTYEVVGAPYGADGSSAAGTIGSDAANTTVHKATFTASAAKTYTVSAKLYEGELMDNFEGENTRGWAGDNLGDGSMTFANNPVKMTVNGSNKVMQVTRTGGADHGGAIMSFTAVGDRVTCDAAGSNDYAYIHARMKNATDATHLKNNDAAGNTDDINPTFDGATSSDWRHVTYHNTHCSNNFLFFMIQRGNTENKTVYIDDIILSNEETMTVKASEAATASFSINWNYTVTLNNNGATSAGTTSVDVTYGSALSDITVPTKTGYTFGGYYTEDAGAGTLQINASGVWQNAGYVSGGNWNSGSNQTLYAKWTENKRNVTISVSPSGAGTLNKTSASVGVVTTTTVTATAQPGYRFTGWNATNCSVASTSSASTTLSGNGTTGAATLVANFARTYAYLEGRMTVYNAARTSETHTASSKGGWDESSTRIEMEYDETNHRFYRHTYKTPAELKAQISSQDQWFSVKTGTVHNSFASGTVKAYHPSSNTNIATAGTKYSAPTTSTTYNFKFTNTATDGYAIIYFDEAGVWYELEQSLKYDANGGSGDAPTPTYYLRGTNATAASNPFTARKNYTFAGWNTAADITGTSYAAGASVPMSADRILYAKWNRSVTLDQQDATTPGSTSVTATWNCSTLPSITNPQKLGYEFGGWYTETAGNGNIIINTSGQLQANKTNWTVSGGKFQRTPSSDASESKPLYAKWTQTVTLNANLANHGSGDNTTATIVYKATAKTSITHCTPATGYHLEGYYTAATDGVKVLNADGSFASSAVTDYITDGKWTKAGATTLYAHYEANTYTIAFDPNDANYVGEATGTTASIDATYGVSYLLTANGFTREGYTFAGWATTPTGAVAYTNGQSVNNLTDENEGTVTLYAKWTGLTYTVTFNARGGSSLSVSSTTVTMGSTYGAGTGLSGEMPTVTAPTGYIFDGWYTASVGGTKVTKTTQVTTASDHTLYAHYVQKAQVYFKNTLGWSKVYVTYDSWWNGDGQGAGNEDRKYHKMKLVSGTTDVYYDDIPDEYLTSWRWNIAFDNTGFCADEYKDNPTTGTYHGFNTGEAVFRYDFDKNATMFVPTSNTGTSADGNYTKNGVQYRSTGYSEESSGPKYTSGYWRTYNDTYSGYTLTYQKKGGSWSGGHKMESAKVGDNVFCFTVNMEANSQYNFSFYKNYNLNDKSKQFCYNPSTQINSSNCTNLQLDCNPNNSYMQTTVAGDYVFKLEMKNDGHMYLTVEYPFKANDYKVVYSYTKDGAKTYDSEIIRGRANGLDTISVFIHSGDSATARSLTIEQCTAINNSGVATWNTSYATITLPSETASGKTSGVYNFIISQDGSAAATGAYWNKYTGNYYIRTAASDGGWDMYKYRPNNIMTLSEYSLTQTLSAPYSHYYCRYIESTTMDITYAVATDYSPNISGILVGDATIGGDGNKTLPASANVRFTYNENTNALRRAYLKSAQGSNTRFLVLHGDDRIFNASTGAAIMPDGDRSLDASELLFSDLGNWIYQVELQAYPSATVKLIAQYNGSDRYLVGDAGHSMTIMGGTPASTKYAITAVYDFKTNRLMTVWTPSVAIGDALVDVDMLLVRHKQEDATSVTFNPGGSLTTKKVYGAIRLDYKDLVGKVASWTTTSRPLLKYMVSFPFDVNISDIFGLNTRYGEAYVIQKYDGADRAARGFFRGDGTTTFWKDMEQNEVMRANVGYCVIFDNDYLNGDLGAIWENKSAESSVYLYFPSAGNVGAIASSTKNIEVTALPCNIDREFTVETRTLNHKYTDSNWNLIGVPIFQNSDGVTSSATITTSEDTGDQGESYGTFYYFYDYDVANNRYSIASAAGYNFKTMYSYMLQYAGTVTFTGSTPSSVAARRIADTKKYEIELQVLRNDEEVINRTFVNLKENACDTFALNEDVYMNYNSQAVNIYTLAGNYDVAANVLSIDNHIVPVGVEVTKAGNYSFSMPSDFDGTVVLVDNFDGSRTDLSLGDYSVALPKGTIEDRFTLEINIERSSATDIEGIEGGDIKDGKAHKFVRDGIMYILRDGVIYDAMGKRVK